VKKRKQPYLWKDPRSGVLYYRRKVAGRIWRRSLETTDPAMIDPATWARHHAAAELLAKSPSGLRRLASAIVSEVDRVETDKSFEQACRVGIALENFLRFAGDLPLDRIDAALVERYQRKRLTEPRRIERTRRRGKRVETRTVELSPAARSTVDKEVGFILRLLRKNGYQIAKPEPKAGRRTIIRGLTRTELPLFFRALPERYQLLFKLMLATGAREEEMLPSKRSRCPCTINYPLLYLDRNGLQVCSSLKNFHRQPRWKEG